MKQVTKPIALLGIASGLALSACSETENGGAADLSTPQTTAEQAANVVAVVSSVGAIAPSSGTTSKASTGICDSGDDDETVLENQNVGSPYTSNTFSVARTTFDNCRLNEDFDGSGGENDYIQFNGLIEGGSASDEGDDISYGRIGADANTPLNMVFHTDNGTSSRDITYNLNFLTHGRETSANNHEQQFFAMIDGDFDAEFDIGFSVQIGGSESDRFVANTNADGLDINGSYDIRTSDNVGGASASFFNCAASASVSTNVRLVESAGTTIFQSGEIELTAGDQSATVRFNSDNTVTVTSADGSTDTFNQSDLQSESQACSGLLLSGLAFANF